MSITSAAALVVLRATSPPQSDSWEAANGFPHLVQLVNRNSPFKSGCLALCEEDVCVCPAMC